MPPSLPSTKPTESPYDFIVNEAPKPRKPSLLSNQTSFKQRLLIILGGGIVLIIVIIIISSLFSSKPKTAGLLSLAQQQSTLITLAAKGEQTASQQITKDLATNVSLSLTTGRLSLVTYLDAAGSKLTAASLVTTQSVTLSTELTSTPANNFDFEYAQLTQTLLTSYVSSIKQVFSANQPANVKVILRNLYAGASLLLKEADTAVIDL